MMMHTCLPNEVLVLYSTAMHERTELLRPNYPSLGSRLAHSVGALKPVRVTPAFLLCFRRLDVMVSNSAWSIVLSSLQSNISKMSLTSCMHTTHGLLTSWLQVGYCLQHCTVFTGHRQAITGHRQAITGHRQAIRKSPCQPRRERNRNWCRF